MISLIARSNFRTLPIGLAILAATIGGTRVATAQNLIANGSFENGVSPDLIGVELYAGDSTSIVGWTILSGNLDYVGVRWVAHHGVRCIDLSGSVAGTISQTVSGLAVGNRYELSFQMAVNPEAPPPSTNLRVIVAGTTNHFTVTTPGSTSNLKWVEQKIEFTADSASTSLRFISLNFGWAGPVLDSITLLGVSGPAAIIANPTDHVALVGSSTSFSVTATGSYPLTYQWYFGETPLPNETNAVLNISNVGFSHAGSYSVVVANSFGPVSSTAATLTVVNPPARVQVVSVEALAGGPVEVPIRLVANGDENALRFSLAFDTTRLAFVSAALGENATDGALVVNNTTADSGRIGLSIALPAGQTFAIGTQTVARITFEVKPTATAVATPVVFGDLPVLRQLSNAAAGSLTAAYVDGSVSALPSTVRAGEVATSSGGAVAVPVTLLALGNENAVSFSIGFDTGILSFSGVQPGAGLPVDASVLVNTNHIGSGRVGISVALASGTAFERGSSELVKIDFEVATVLNPLTTTVTFGNSPTIRQVSSATAQPLPGVFQNGRVSVESVVFEADSAPRPEGDRVLSVIDWVQAGRFAAALDTVDANEFQRVDCAPRATRGNGVISVADWVQAGRYSAGLDPVTGIGGPTEPAIFAPAAAGAAAGSGCEVRITNTNVLPGGILNVPVIVSATGTENALGFSVTFDVSKLRFISATKLSAANSATLNLNSSQTLSGRLGVALALPIGSSFSAGRQEILLLSFEAAAAGSGTTTLGFGDTPVVREAVSVTANAIPSTFSNGVVTLGPPSVVGPSLAIARSGESVLLFWPATEAGFELYSAGAPANAAWTKVLGTPIEIGGQKIFTLPRSGDQKYFRLQKQ